MLYIQMWLCEKGQTIPFTIMYIVTIERMKGTAKQTTTGLLQPILQRYVSYAHFFDRPDTSYCLPDRLFPLVDGRSTYFL